MSRTQAFLNHGGPVQHADLGLLACVGDRRDGLAVVLAGRSAGGARVAPARRCAETRLVDEAPCQGGRRVVSSAPVRSSGVAVSCFLGHVHGGPVQHADLGLLACVGDRRDGLAVVASEVKALLGLAER